ncbi:MAG: pitrilysin family protein [Catalinimonas sp.]
MTPDYEVHQFDNGIRLIHRQVLHTRVAHCGFVLDVGSRDETPDQLGLAHFWEHMAFKGTRRRKAFHIINRLEAVGGELNAYTTKEKLCFYASVLDRHFDKAAELLTDITFDSVFPEREIERERGVILEEMSMYVDTPEDAIQDEFDELVFGNHPLGTNILGTAESVRRFHREDFRRFVGEHLDTHRLVFASVGNVAFRDVIRRMERRLADLPARTTHHHRRPFADYQPRRLEKDRPITQAHAALGRTAFPLHDERRLPFFMLNNLLGGPGMNSRLNLALRERHGYVYAVESSFTSYIDTGLFGIFFGTEPRRLKQSLDLTYRELRQLREKPLGSVQLHNLKEQLMGQLAMAEENNAGLMLLLGKSLLDLGYVESLADIFDRIRAVTSSELQTLANDTLREEDLSVLIYRPEA